MKRLLAALLVAATIGIPTAAAAGDPTRILVFTRTTGYRHAAIEPAVAAIEELGRQHDFEVTATDDPAVFATDTLRDYDAVVFMSTTGNPVSEPAPRRGLRRYVEQGGGFVGVHAASDQDEESRSTWPWYGKLLGAYFGGHPLYDARPTGDESCATAGVVSCHTGVVRFEDRTHPATREVIRDNGVLGATGAKRRFWDVYDEFYGFATNPRDRVHVLATLDEKTYLDDPLLPTSSRPGRWGGTTRSRGAGRSSGAAPSTPGSATTRRCSRTSATSTTWSAGSSGPPAASPATAVREPASCCPRIRRPSTRGRASR